MSIWLNDEVVNAVGQLIHLRSEVNGYLEGRDTDLVSHDRDLSHPVAVVFDSSCASKFLAGEKQADKRLDRRKGGKQDPLAVSGELDKTWARAEGYTWLRAVFSFRSIFTSQQS
jgi:hypothetical protein